MRRLRVESTTDNEIATSYAANLIPANINELTVTVSQRPRVREDGNIERVEPTVETASFYSPTQETLQNRATYTRRLEKYKRDNPQAFQDVDPNTPCSLAAIDEINRQPNGPAITNFLGSAPEVAAALSFLSPVEQAQRIQEITMTSTSGDSRTSTRTMKLGGICATARKPRGAEAPERKNKMSEDKIKCGVDDVAKYENENRRDTYDESHGTGNPHLQPGELRQSAAWKAHKSAPSPAANDQKSPGPVEPPKKSE